MKKLIPIWVLLLILPGAAWWNESWNLRIPVTVTENSNTDLFEYIVALNITYHPSMKLDFSDIIVTYLNNSVEEPVPYWIAHVSDSAWAYVWVKVPFIPARGTAKLYVYFDNPSHSSFGSPESVFTYSEPRTVGYIVSDRLAAAGLKVMSLTDGNTICVDAKCVNLNSMETYVFTGLSQGSVIRAKSLFQADGFNSSAVDMINPVSWASTEFSYRSNRGTNRWSICSPFGTANVRILDSGREVYSSRINGCTAVTVDIINGDTATIVSDIPVLVQHYTTELWDSRVLAPPATELLGIGSNLFEIGTGSSQAYVSWIRSDGLSGSVLLPAYSNYYLSGLGSYGNAPAFRVSSDSPIGANQLADSDGGETTTFLSLTETGTVFGSGNRAGYIAVAAPYPSTTCRVYNSAGTEVAYQTGGTGKINKLCFGCGSTATWINGPWKMVCDKPVYAYYENDAFESDETNLLSYPQMRQFVYPEPTVSLGIPEAKFPARIVREHPDRASPGSTFTIRLIAINYGSEPIGGVSIIEDYSAFKPTSICCGGIDNGTHITWNVGLIGPGEFYMVDYNVTAPGAGNYTLISTLNGTASGRTDSVSSPGKISVSSGAFFDVELDADASTPEIEREVPLGSSRIAKLTIKNIGDSEVNQTFPLVYQWFFPRDVWKVYPAEGSGCIVKTLNTTHGALECKVNYLPPGASTSFLFSLEAIGKNWTGTTASLSSWDPLESVVNFLNDLVKNLFGGLL
ncbi:MAG: DUF2341 domain-containing protein [Candidatus Micrarchaeota archaeon]|nr:DUF2341 domain-containing protein [Candidatus Micrarchaeota archaeon]